MLLIIIVVLGLSIGYSAYNQELMISGEGIVRVEAPIRIIDIQLVETTNGGKEVYNSEYSKDTTIIFTNFSNINSTLTYEITVKNSSNDLYVLKDITSNFSDISFQITNMEVGDLIQDNSVIQFNIIVSSNTLLQDLLLELKYDFEKLESTTFVYDYSGSIEEFEVPVNGTYKIELWGASGGSNFEEYPGGNGAYTTGVIELNYQDVLYVNVGGEGAIANRSTALGGYNGGGSSQVIGAGDYAGSGGGSTDIRLVNDTKFGGLKSRIMVAAGGGGAYHFQNGTTGISYIGTGGAGGTLNGILPTIIRCDNRPNIIGTPSTQTIGAENNVCSSDLSVEIGSEAMFGQGSNGVTWSSGGGGGYYGGGSGYATGASGGSSYISGYLGCNAIAEESTENNIIHTNQPNHYSNYIFTSSQMIAGNEEMPSPNNEIIIGNHGNGYARITLIDT